jgi:V8-like Glu-specific endopeptidase
MPTVGPLFPPGVSVHSCTASVVDSTAGNLLITAAHCISGTAHGYVFAPGYRGGIEPFGSWTVIGAYGAPDWIARQAPEDDFAFLLVAPHLVNGHTEQIQQVTGGNRLGTAPAAGDEVTVPAYSFGSNDDPITCTTPVHYDATYPAFNCSPYADGTSGAPWLQHRANGWSVVGVIGGLHQGGCQPSTSYSAAFGPATFRTASSAASRADTSTFPSAGSDGCSTGS